MANLSALYPTDEEKAETLREPYLIEATHNNADKCPECGGLFMVKPSWYFQENDELTAECPHCEVVLRLYTTYHVEAIAPPKAWRAKYGNG